MPKAKNSLVEVARAVANVTLRSPVSVSEPLQRFQHACQPKPAELQSSLGRLPSVGECLIAALFLAPFAGPATVSPHLCRLQISAVPGILAAQARSQPLI